MLRRPLAQRCLEWFVWNFRDYTYPRTAFP